MFTYQLDSDDAGIAAVSRLRLEIGDNREDDGVLMDGSNFSDEELAYYLGKNGDDIGAAVTELCSVLARHWSRAADVAVGPRRESLSQVATAWQERAKAPASGTAAMRAFFARVPASA